MAANPPLQARAGANSPIHALAPSYDGGKGYLYRLAAALVPGVDLKIVEGRPGNISTPSLRVYIGANVGAAVLTLTATLRRNSDGAIFETETQAGFTGPQAAANFNIGIVVPEGFSLWLNTTLTAGVYGGDASAEYSVVHTDLFPVGPVDLLTTLTTVMQARAGHALLAGSLNLQVFNRDTAIHVVESYLTTPLGDVIIHNVTVAAGAVGNLIPSTAPILNPGESLRSLILTPIVTPGRSVTVIGVAQETNRLNE